MSELGRVLVGNDVCPKCLLRHPFGWDCEAAWARLPGLGLTPAPETPTPAVLAPEGTEDGRSNSPGIDPEKSSLRERVRGLEEALRPFADHADYFMPAEGSRTEVFPFVGRDGLRRWLSPEHFRQAQAALLPLPEGGRGKAAQSQPLTDAGPYPRSPEPPHSDGKED